MGEFAVLTNRKRALIALIHSVVFMLIAVRGLVSSSHSQGLISAMHSHVGVSGATTLAAIYFIVSAVLIWLFAISRCTRERLYFGLCATSAATGLLRAIVGDPPFHVSHYIRVVMLVSAVLVGTVIWRGFIEEPGLSGD